MTELHKRQSIAIINNYPLTVSLYAIYTEAAIAGIEIKNILIALIAF